MPELEEKIENVVDVPESASPDTTTAAENTSVTEEVAAPTETNVEVGNEDTTKGSDIKTGPTELEKATYSFHKQFARQRSKYEKQISDLKAEIEQIRDRQVNPDKYRPKQRSDFEYDDDYMDYRAEQKFNALMEARKAEEAKRTEENEKLEAMTNYYRERAQKNMNTLFTTDEAKKHYQEVLDSSPEEMELLDKDPRVANYLMRSSIGPAMLLEILENKEIYLPRLFEDPYMSSEDRKDEMKAIEQEVKQKLEQAKREAEFKAAEVKAEPTKPVIGKPGITTPATKNIWEDDKALDDFLASRR